jgi:DNA-binding GntR family transcriptional regulator
LKELTRPPTLAVAAAESIKEEIIQAKLLPGTALHEVELSRSLNISRGTVREALRLLDQEGFVEVIPYRGAFVSTLTPKMVKEIYTLRGLLEPTAVRLSMENVPPGGEYLEELRTLVHRLGEMEQIGDYAETIKADIKFHEMSIQNCQHDLLLGMIKNLQSLTLMFILNTKLYRSDMVSDEVSHQAIFDGIASGDPQAAEEIVRKHIYDAGTSLLARMEETEWASQPVSP